jgi:hypothetical protein
MTTHTVVAVFRLPCESAGTEPAAPSCEHCCGPSGVPLNATTYESSQGVRGVDPASHRALQALAMRTLQRNRETK